MKFLKVNDKLLIMDGRDPLQYVDLATQKLYKFPAVHIDEASELPVFKWWRNPKRWWQWRRVKRIARRNTKIVLFTTPAGQNAFYKITKKGK